MWWWTWRKLVQLFLIGAITFNNMTLLKWKESYITCLWNHVRNGRLQEKMERVNHLLQHQSPYDPSLNQVLGMETKKLSSWIQCRREFYTGGGTSKLDRFLISMCEANFFLYTYGCLLQFPDLYMPPLLFRYYLPIYQRIHTFLAKYGISVDLRVWIKFCVSLSISCLFLSQTPFSARFYECEWRIRRGSETSQIQKTLKQIFRLFWPLRNLK